METVKYPIAEIFTSPQGEGLWAGTLMTFIRFAGCNVGKVISKVADSFMSESVGKDTEQYGNLPIWQEECTTYDGRKFLCDTDFRVKERLDVGQILERVPKGVEHICLSGGEPLLHNLEDLITRWVIQTKYSPHKVHIETSGTRMLSPAIPWSQKVWVTVSPKAGYSPRMIVRANELKFLVDADFPEEKTVEIANMASENVVIWVSPINDTHTIDKENMQRCLDLITRHPTWRITNQNHKLWGVR